MENSPIMFKSAVGGFDKKAVMSYIFELNESAQAAQKRLIEELEEVSRIRDDLEDQLNDVHKRMQRAQMDVRDLSDELAGEKSRTAELTELLENANADVDRLRQEIAQKDEEIRRLAAAGPNTVPQPVTTAPTPAPQPAPAVSASAAGASEEAKNTIEQLQQTVARLNSKLAQTNSELAQQRQIIVDKDAVVAEKDRLIAEKDQLLAQKGGQPVPVTAQPAPQPVATSSLSSADAQRLRELEQNKRQVEDKLREVDKASAQIGRILLDATGDAEKIRNEAQTEGERILYNANKEADGILFEARKKASSMEKKVESFYSDINHLQRQILEAAANMHSRAEQVGTIIGEAQGNFYSKTE